jgi:uncharacterized protein (DUF362 family)
MLNVLDDPRVAIKRLPATSYADDEVLASALDWLGEVLGWRAASSAFDGVVPAGSRVLVKPNWVAHANQGAGGLDPLITHSALIRAVVRALLRSGLTEVVVGDAPLQLCDFDRMIEDSQVATWSPALTDEDERYRGIRDFRRTTCEYDGGRRAVQESRIPDDQFVLFDLKSESLLEPVTDDRASFRVTQYNPTHMIRTHGPGRHQYLVARAAIEADVVVNMPKLKTHKKAGVTCALKNLIGINGNKEYLPHHRVGGSNVGGDCYPGGNRVKRVLELAFDRLNQADSSVARRFWENATRMLDRAVRLTGDRLGVEGSWYGNDTIWRTCLDLNRILLYGRLDGTLANEPQRGLVHVVDAVIAGHGDGPLAPKPLPLRIVLAGWNAAAVDWVGAMLLGYDPERIPIARESFGDYRWPLAHFRKGDIRLVGDLGEGPAIDVFRDYRSCPGISYPRGWEAAVATEQACG